MKKNILCLIAAFFLVCFTVANVTADDGINWRPPESDSEFIGNWTGSVLLPVSDSIHEMVPNTALNLLLSVDCTKIAGADYADFYLNAKLDIEKFLDDFSGVAEIERQNFSKDELWDIFLAVILRDRTIVSVDLDTGKYFVGYNTSFNTAQIINYYPYGYVLLNDKGDTIRLVFYNKVSFGLGDGFSEIILQK